MNAMKIKLPLHKMRTEHADPVRYYLTAFDTEFCVNDYIGKQWTVHYHKQINCQHCGRQTNKSFAQGYCFPCFQSLAQCDSCMMSPEKCHYHLGTCRDSSWGETHCMQTHYVYLANSSGLKVGITRITNVPFRWIDQGAISALPIYAVSNRLQSGLLEVAFKQQLNDRTNWRKMLKGEAPDLDLVSERERLMPEFAEAISAIKTNYDDSDIQFLADAKSLAFVYPGEYQLDKIKSINLDKTPIFTGILLGIKAQYLIFDCGVINIRKYGGYAVTVEIDE